MGRLTSAVARWRGIADERGVDQMLRDVSNCLRSHARSRLWADLGLVPSPERAVQGVVGAGRRLRPGRYTDADPLKVLEIDPAKIRRRVESPVYPFGRVFDGDWDVGAPSFMDGVRQRSMVAHFVEGVPWEETAYYRHARSSIESRGFDRSGCSSRSELEDRLERLDDLYDRIDRRGYASQRELLANEPELTIRENNDEPVPTLNEIGVAIGRDGEFLFSFCGLHRLTIARILDVEAVPVQVRGRHRHWQRIRDSIRLDADGPTLTDGGISDVPIDHPDLADLLGSDRGSAGKTHGMGTIGEPSRDEVHDRPLVGRSTVK